MLPLSITNENIRVVNKLLTHNVRGEKICRVKPELFSFSISMQPERCWRHRWTGTSGISADHPVLCSTCFLDGGLFRLRHASVEGIMVGGLGSPGHCSIKSLVREGGANCEWEW